MKRWHIGVLFLAAATAVSMSPALSDTVTGPVRIAAAPTTLPAGHLSVLTYNVKGLPWPIATGRPRALAEIGDRLARMRAEGTAPHVVVLQEAFTPDAEAIAQRAGYRYTAYGPGQADARPVIAGLAPKRDVLKGEGLGSFLSSGLVIMSDYRLSGIRHTAFPEGACAGYDCLANKGILSARVAVPGLRAPVEVITAHFNSGNPSGQPEKVSRVAYEEQVEAMDEFTSRAESRRTVRIYAGDFNVGHSPARLALLAGYIKNKRAKVATAMGKERREYLCRTSSESCREGLALASNVPLVHANDWQFYSTPGDVHLLPVAREEMFKDEMGGKKLSDHLGLKVIYRFQ